MYTNNYTKEREYKEYNSVLSIRLNKDFYTFLHKINPINISSTIRSLIRSDLYEGEIEITQKEVRKMFRRSDNNINNYIDLLIMEFINNISDKHEKYRWG